MKNNSSLNDQLDKYLKNLFTKYSPTNGLTGEIAKRGYVACEPEVKDLLCIGINPSYLEDSKPESYIYTLNGAINEYPSHYKRFNDIVKAGNYGEKWGYMDLLYLREKVQKEIWTLMKSDDGLDFICDQLKISQKFLETLKPKVLFIANSDARRFFGADQNTSTNDGIWMGYQLEFDEDFGVHIITGIHKNNLAKIDSTKLIGVPVIFSGALTYMDSYSKAKLSWFLRKITKHYPLYFGEAYSNRDKMA